jgi:translation initiation factor 1
MKTKHNYRGVVMDRAPPAVAPKPLPKGPPKVRVGREVAGRGGKGVTVITGLPLAAPELQALATRLKKSCGAGGAVNNAAIEIQGDHRDRLVAELQKLGYDAKRSGG